MKPAPLLCASLFASLLATPAPADEGMWTFDNFPTALVKQRYGVAIDDRWLEHVRLASARIAGGCSASFVSSRGLVMTNHHCVHRCVSKLSTKERDLVKDGFLARREGEELRCPDFEVNQLVSITDVSERIRQATQGLSAERYNQAEKAESSRIERECAGAKGEVAERVRCDVVSLYQGARHHLYRYRRFQDVRLAFAPEFAIAFFGGDPDNFEFPRYDLDVAFLRVFDGGKPLRSEHFLGWSRGGAKPGEAVFVSGNPGTTSRRLTVAQLETNRDFSLPDRLITIAQLRGLLGEFQNRGPEAKRISTDVVFGLGNAFKGLSGRHDALRDRAFVAGKIQEEQALRERVAKDPALQQLVGGAWEEIAAAQARYAAMRKPLRYLEEGVGFRSDLFGIARSLVRGADERVKPNEERFREFAESRLPQVQQKLFSSAPIHDELEVATLAFSLDRLREELGADDPMVRKILGPDSPAALAARLIQGTRLKDVALRRRLWEGGQKAVQGSDDPLIKLARLIDPEARALRRQYEDTIEGVVKRAAQAIARVRLAVEGPITYPDATFSPRLSFGKVAGWDEGGRAIPPLTTLGGTFDRATGEPPFALPERWVKGRAKLDPNVPFNLATTNDIIGGNSGSPLIAADGRAVGLVFDSNIHGLAGDYRFDERRDRAIAVSTAAITHALQVLYDGAGLLDELGR